MNKGIFHRSELLLGRERMQLMATKKVIIFGIGGVGSWCAESLVRTGIQNLTIVDSDRVCITNVNRQLMATCKTVGQVKTEALRNRLLEINPKAQITAIQQIFDKDTCNNFNLEQYDFIIDAIDSLTNKMLLIHMATRTKALLFSSFGAALKIDATRIKVAEFWNALGCPLGSKLRKMMRRRKLFPARKFMVVYSDEVLENLGANEQCGTEKCLCPKSVSGSGNPDLADHEWCSLKAQINGSLAHITATFGNFLAGLVIKSVYNELNTATKG